MEDNIQIFSTIPKYPTSKEATITYKSEDGNIQLSVFLSDDTVWLTQQQMALLFHSSKQNINWHIKNIFKEGELDPISTVKDNLTVQAEENGIALHIHNKEYNSNNTAIYNFQPSWDP